MFITISELKPFKSLRRKLLQTLLQARLKILNTRTLLFDSTRGQEEKPKGTRLRKSPEPRLTVYTVHGYHRNINAVLLCITNVRFNENVEITFPDKHTCRVGSSGWRKKYFCPQRETSRVRPFRGATAIIIVMPTKRFGDHINYVFRADSRAHCAPAP